jgi:hypothetical protein
MSTTQYYDTFRRLTCDVKNPDHDGRKHYGADAVKILKEGTALYEFTRKPDEKFSVGTLFWSNSNSVYTTKGFGEALLANSVVCQPETWRERVRFATGSSTHTDSIIDQLVASGVVTPEQVAQAAIDRDQEEAKS